MLAPTLILAFSGLGLPAELGTVSSDNHTEEPATMFRRAAPRPEFDRQFTLEARLGVATPTGLAGVAAEFSFIPQFGVGCGVGSNVYDAEYACWLRARPVIGVHRALTLSSGFSTAAFTQTEATQAGVLGIFTAAFASMREGPGPDERSYARAYWLNTDLGYETRRAAFVFRVFGGIAALMNPSDGVVQQRSSPDALPANAPLSAMAYAGVGLGLAE
ncbi:MAG: hypothetical protein ABJB12_19900 [Pseudomonadota bacterium]